MTSFAMLILADDGNDANGEELGLTIGEETGVHFKIESGSLLYVSVKPGAPATDDTRVFTAITANIANAELLGIDGVTAQIVSFSVDVNKAAGQYGTDPVAEALDWTGAIDADQDGNFEAPTFAVPTGADPIELSVTYEEDVFGASGRFIVNLFDFVTGDVDFKYVNTTEDVVISDTETLTDAQVTRLSLRVRSLFVGVPDGPGFRVSDSPEADGGDADLFAGTIVLASIKPSKADAAERDDARRALVAGDQRRPRPRLVRGHPEHHAGLRHRHARDQPGRGPQGHDRGRGARLDHRLRRRQRRSGRLRGRGPRRRRAPDRVRRGALPAPGDGHVQRVRLRPRDRADHGRQGGRRRRAQGRAGQRHRHPDRRAAAHDRARDQPRQLDRPGGLPLHRRQRRRLRDRGRHDLHRVAEGQEACPGEHRAGRPAHLVGDQLEHHRRAPRRPPRGLRARRRRARDPDQPGLRRHDAARPAQLGRGPRHRRQRRLRRGRRGRGHAR